MKILGLSFGTHDSSYAIIEDGKIVVHEELERFSRIKECDGNVIDFYLDRHKSFDDIDIVTYFPHGNKKFYPSNFNILLELAKNKIIDLYEVGHHKSHAANAFFSSNFEEALIVTLDGGGWDKTTNGLYASQFTVWQGKDIKIEPKVLDGSWNPGVAWSKCTANVFGMCGGGPPYGCQAGTVMAMAAIGNSDKFYNELKDQDIWGWNFHWEKYSNISEKDKFDFAATLQRLTEEKVRFELSKWITKDTKYLCLAGGTVLNSVMTGKLWDWFPHLVDIYIPPVPYDAGLAIGCAQFLSHHVLNFPRIKWRDNASPYLGVTYTKEEVLTALNKYDNIIYKDSNDDHICDLLYNAKIVSVYGGPSESGRRALGNRSILADPTNPHMKDIVNEKVKHRQSFRPFAPSIIREEMNKWFTRDVNSPYMGFVLQFKKEVQDKVPAVVHVDGSARLQTVTEKDNKWYYNFLKKWQVKSGVPIILNTSFNDREPIVEKPEHAINCFLKTNIDYLYFFDYNILVEKIKD